MYICVGAWLEARDKMIVQAFFLNTNNCPHGLVKCACMRWKLHPSSFHRAEPLAIERNSGRRGAVSLPDFFIFE